MRGAALATTAAATRDQYEDEAADRVVMGGRQRDVEPMQRP